MPNHKETQESILTIHKEKNQLEKNNDVLAEKIATTHALQNYYQKLKEHNRALKKSQIQHSPTQIDVDNLYDQEIERLQQELKVCQDREKVLDREFGDAEHDLKQAKLQFAASEKHVEELRQINDQARSDADKAVAELNILTQECEELNKVLKFNSEVHAAELENLRNLVNRPQNHYDPKYQDLPYQEIDISQVLDDFRKEYQDILEKAYEQERRDLIGECVRLEQRIQDLESQLKVQQVKINRTNQEINNLKDELENLEKQAKLYKAEGAAEQKKFEKERDNILSEIVKMEQKKQEQEKELQRLIDEDNRAVKLIIQLQLEINAYRALMEAEEGKYVDIDANGILEIPLSTLPNRKSSSSSSDSSISHV